MNRILPIILLAVLIVGSAAIAVALKRGSTSSPTSTAAAVTPATPIKLTNFTKTPADPGGRPPAVTPDEIREYRRAQREVVEKGPDLQRQYRDIITDFKAQCEEWQEAMLRADPQVRPILAKLQPVHSADNTPITSSLSLSLFRH